MSDIPRDVLSEHFEERLNGRRLITAAFFTFRFDPAFFEEEVLPVFLNVPLSHAPAIRVAQLEEPLRSLAARIAVYFDVNGLSPDARPAKLDTERIPIALSTGIFHPKNVFALVEDIEPDDDGVHHRALLIASMSANLTRAGWWENVEACHIEELQLGARTRLRDDVLAFFKSVVQRCGDKAPQGHQALNMMRELVRGTTPRIQRSDDGRLHTHFYSGIGSLPDFISSVCGSSLEGMNLEIISPYFDGDATSSPLAELVERFAPREVRVFLPRGDAGEALCNDGLYSWLREQPKLAWSKLPTDMLRLGKSDDVKQRFVHAKVYRFFNAKREVIVLGSANLTRAAHQNGGNAETGFLVEVDNDQKADWWTVPDTKRPAFFTPKLEDEGTATSGGTRLTLRYWWDKNLAEAYWDSSTKSPALKVDAQGVHLFELNPLDPRTPYALGPDATTALQKVLRSTSILFTRGDGADGIVLVQEYGMTHRPSLFLDLSPADILRYWSLLTAEQRASFLESRASELAALGEGAALISKTDATASPDSLFARFAGIFHAFGCAERGIRASLENDKFNEATHRLFGKKYDSLGNLLARLESPTVESDVIADYVIVVCTKQLVREIARDFPEYWAEHHDDAAVLTKQIASLNTLRERIVARDPAKMESFLDWFDRWFLKRAMPAERQELA